MLDTFHSFIIWQRYRLFVGQTIPYHLRLNLNKCLNVCVRMEWLAIHSIKTKFQNPNKTLRLISHLFHLHLKISCFFFSVLFIWNFKCYFLHWEFHCHCGQSWCWPYFFLFFVCLLCLSFSNVNSLNRKVFSAKVRPKNKSSFKICRELYLWFKVEYKKKINK